MTARFLPARLAGTVEAPPSKSQANRLILAAALADGRSVIRNVAPSADMVAMIGAVRAMGAHVAVDGDTLTIDGGHFRTGEELQIDCQESGTALRFLMPILPALGFSATLFGGGRLPNRPYDMLANELVRNGAKFSALSGLPVQISGKLQPGTYTVPGNLSSQIISGLLFALPLLDGPSRIVIKQKTESRSYIDLTLDVLEKFGISVEPTADGFAVAGGQAYRPADLRVEGDFSNAAFWLAAAALGHDIEISGLDTASRQGDRYMLEFLQNCGAKVINTSKSIRVEAEKLHAADVDASEIPDLIPIISLVLARAEGRAKITHAGRLRLKECDRFQAVVTMLEKLGVPVEAEGDTITIEGRAVWNGTDLEGLNDHRMVMCAAIAALGASGPLSVTDAMAVTKSYPDFFEKYRSLGGIVDGLDLGK